MPAEAGDGVCIVVNIHYSMAVAKWKICFELKHATHGYLQASPHSVLLFH